ncbi:MAG: nitronate monooxygenase [Proteobacteria bacterium]|nr:nitronate monooxygenase [Pseudomonadota bacterium]
MKKSAALGIGISATPISTVGQQPDEHGHDERGVLSEKSQALLKRFNLKYPIFQAAPGGEELAVAVANSGGMGAISLSWDAPELAVDVVTRLRKATKGNFYANYVLHFEPNSLDQVLEAGCPNVQFSWGIPGKNVVAKIRNAGAGLGIQVSSRQNAERALEREPDFLICQGLEAGGHVQATSLLFPTLQAVLELAGDVPVLAAGGISTGHDIRNALNAGASGVILGTRLMATVESDAHDVYKSSLIDAGEDSTVYTICFNRDWNATHRVLRNKTFLDWEADGCPDTGNKPGEDDVVANHPDLGPALRYETVPPLQGHEGALDEMAMYAGQGVDKIYDLPSARELITRLWKEFENT